VSDDVVALPAPEVSTRPWRWVGTLFFAEGLAPTVVTTIAVLVLNRLGVSNSDVAFYTSAFTLPWVLRPLFSPLLEMVRANRALVVGSQGAMALAFAAMSAGLLVQSRTAVYLILFAAIAVSAAVHDTVADGIYICHLSPAAQARYVGWLGVAFNVAKFTTQGALVILAGALEGRGGALFGWQVSFAILALLTAGLALYHARYLPPEESPPPSVTSDRVTLRDVLSSFFAKPDVGWLLVLVGLYRLGEGQLVRIVPLFLLDAPAHAGAGLSTAQIGSLYGGGGAAAFVAGALVGGWVAGRLGLRRALFLLCASFNAPSVIYLLLSWTQARALAPVAGGIVLEQFAYGFGSIGLKLIMMQAIAPGRYQTAHFSFAAGLAGLSATIGGMISGRIADALGYSGFFAYAALIAVPTLWVAYVWSRRQRQP